MTQITGTEGSDFLFGGSADDTILGLGGGDQLNGGGGNDTLDGGPGNDLLTGGAGIDSLTGGSGVDTFQDTASGLNGDTVADFMLGDRIQITDVPLQNSNVHLSGSSIVYNGGSITIGNGLSPGRLVLRSLGTTGTEVRLQQDAHNDFNGDGRSDILWRNDNGLLTDWLGTANGSFSPNSSNALYGVSTDWQVAGTGDFNGDGRVDVMWRNIDGRITNWLGTANGGLSDNVANAYNGVSNDWHVAGIGDFNGDGRDDILWRNTDGRATDWLSTPNGGYAPNSANFYNNISIDWQIVGAGDFNGDGHDDIMWRNVDGRITNWLGTDTGSFTDNVANAYNGVSTDWHVAGIGDFNGDGRDDILWRNTDGRITDWLSTANGGYAPNSANFYTSLDNSWHVVAVGDYNGDATDDILWRNNDGRITDWLGNSTGGFTDNAVNSLNGVDTHWHVQPAELFL
jgi:hypothetical protein